MNCKPIAILALLTAFAASAAPVVKDGKPVSAVRIGDNPTLRYAAQELTNWVCKISGGLLPVNPSGKASTEIFIGTPETSAEIAAFARKNADDFAKLGKTDGFVVGEDGGNIFIAGNCPKGALNGTYYFLTENTDLIFVRDMHSEDGFGTIYGNHPSIDNAVKKAVEVPSLPHHRHIRGTEPWQIRMYGNFPFSGYGPDALKRLEAHRVLNNVQSVGMGFGFNIIDQYKETDPDLFPLLENGKRDFGHDHQLCFMNPKAWDLYSAEIAKHIGWVPEGLESGISLGLGDNWGVCNCKEYCLKDIKLADGTVVKPTDKNFRSTQYAIMVNEVSHRLQKVYPGLKPVETGMYLFLTEPPAVMPDSMNSGCYCPYIKNHKKPVYDDGANKAWHEKAEGFYRKGIRFESLYEYYLCTTTPKFYHAVCEVMQKDLKYYKSHGLTGCYLDTCAYDQPQYENSDVWVLDVSAIEFWVAMKLMWNIDADIKALRREYCRRAFREAGDIMGDFYEKLAENYNADPAGCFWNDDPISATQYYVVERGLAGWVRDTLAKAEAAAKHPGSKELIKRLRGRMEYMVSEAEKKPKKSVVAVGKDWTPVTPLTRFGDGTKPPKPGTLMWVKNDSHNLYLKMVTHRKAWRAIYDKAKADGTLGKVSKEAFDWCNISELYLDGDLAAGGSYYHFAINFDGDKFVAIGPAPDAIKDFVWDYKLSPVDDDGIQMEITWPLASIGVDISKGNKVGAMFLLDDTAWNGGQQNSPTGFQVLQLNMD